jgi:CRISPR-associated protein Cas5d
MKPENLVHLRVWGDFACFTRPEMKVERVSYAIMTPSAARGILEAVFWEPQMYYLIHQITVLRHTAGGREYGKGRWVSFQRNEVCKTVNLKTAGRWMQEPAEFSPIMAGAGSGKGNIAQRNTLALQDVAYLISAEVCLSSLARQPRDNPGKYLREVRDRARAGKCHYRPALGCREFAADFAGVDNPVSLLRCSWPEEDLGLMLYDVFHHKERMRGFAWFNASQDYAELDYEPSDVEPAHQRGHFGQPVAPRACFFRAKVVNAELKCHPEEVAILTSPRSAGYNSASPA